MSYLHCPLAESYSPVPLLCGQVFHHITIGTAKTAAEHKSDFKLTTDTPYLALTDELWDVICEDSGENWLHYNSTVLIGNHFICTIHIIHVMTLIWHNCNGNSTQSYLFGSFTLHRYFYNQCLKMLSVITHDYTAYNRYGRNTACSLHQYDLRHKQITLAAQQPGCVIDHVII